MDLSENKNLLFNYIVEHVFKRTEAQELDRVTQQKTDWVMDFKGVSVNQSFLKLFAESFNEYFKNQGDFQVCGMESGALPLIAAVSLYSSNCKNSFYIRKSAKKSDLAKTIEGKIIKGLPIVIIDDILNQGRTILKQVAVLEAVDEKPAHIFTVIRYRDISFYESVLEGVKVSSFFELDDFWSVLGVSNLSEVKQESPKYSFWRGVWKMKLSKHNPYIVVPKSGIVADEKCVYVGSDDGCMRAVIKQTGEIKWSYATLFREGGKGILSTPAIDDRRVYFGAYDGNFYCVDKETGKRKWVYMDAEWIGSSPCLSKKNRSVFIGLEFGLFKKHGGIVSLDAETGEVNWFFNEMEGLTHASPAVSDELGVVVCGCNDGYVYAFDSKYGNLLWKFKTEDEVKYGAVFDIKRKLVIFGSLDGKVYCVDAYNGKSIFTFTTRAGIYSTPVIWKDNIIIGSLDKSIYCFSLDTKEIKWNVLTRGRVFSSPYLFGDHIFIGSNDGCVYEIDCNTGKTISITQLPDRILNKVYVEQLQDGKVLFVRTDACDLYKFIGN